MIILAEYLCFVGILVLVDGFEFTCSDLICAALVITIYLQEKSFEQHLSQVDDINEDDLLVVFREVYSW